MGMLDKTNGSIFLEEFNCRLYKGMQLEELKQTDYYKAKYDSFRDVNTGYFWYGFNHFDWEGYQVRISICFFGDRLESMYIYTSDDRDAKTWDDWSEKKEMEVFERNNSFMRKLSEEKGKKKNSPYPQWSIAFEWGTLWSVYDPRSASSISGLSYKK
ncbi:hypothetical protein HX082_06105 [Myroides odoratimimus]|uniref:hypothetical protein n=1 Tax=Myroides odoratimimus TaxID=76832 RepID=UPI002576398F|nr:hypothetical protein [Myroides odoratimimus]MDM1508968.1 hypothetical protein [Myroides odoratimimus]MDM1512170.1 hypothetical protein [Myroides odoratimimus]MEC4034615.1 hypothetical protein [Myroides odoratimimus]